jgi:hypothetical protein
LQIWRAPEIFIQEPIAGCKAPSEVEIAQAGPAPDGGGPAFALDFSRLTGQEMQQGFAPGLIVPPV